ncbi:MAG TPA: ABC transporter permease [Rhodanobacteraceae bacterium]
MNVWLTEIWRAWRASLRKPGFLLLAAGVLTLGIGASVAAFTLIDQDLLQPLPIPQASRVGVAGFVVKSNGQLGFMSPLEYQHLTGMQGVASMGLMRSIGRSLDISGSGQPELVSAVHIDHGVLPTLGLKPALGRAFSAREELPHGPHVVMLGHAFWLHRYAGARDVVGKTFEIGGTAYTIIGVMPKAFDQVFGGDLVLPLALPAVVTKPGDFSDTVLLRLADGASRQAVVAQINTRLHAMFGALPESKLRSFFLHGRFTVRSLAQYQNQGISSSLTIFMACALFVLLTALVNLANLMLLRSQSRAHDSAVRGALGATFLRLAWPALAEGMLVGVVGALAGTLLAWLGLRALQGTLSAYWMPTTPITINGGIWLLALVVAVVVAVLAAAFGVWRAQAASAIDELREGGRSGMGRHSRWLGRVLVVVQVVLATVLLCGTGLLLHGMFKLANAPLGITHTAHVLTFDLAPVPAQYPDAKSMLTLTTQLTRRLAAIPGITAATVTTNLPVDQYGNGMFMAGGMHAPDGVKTNKQYRGIGVGYFKLFGISLLRGRAFTRDDVRGGAAVAVVNRALANQMYGGHALGKLIQQTRDGASWSARIVGVVGNTRQFGPLQDAPDIVYVPLAQMPAYEIRAFRNNFPLRFVLRGHGNPAAWKAAVKAAVAQVAPVQPISDFRTMSHVVASTLASTRQMMWLVGIFAALALLLAAAGMYAVLAVAVAAREREFGVRMALGAQPSRLIRLVLRGGLGQIALGLVIGIAIMLSLSSLLQRLLMNLVARSNTFDPVALIGVCVLLGIAGLLACLLPALRASRVQPMHALRGE